jgi:hypothetical protein
VPTPRSSKLRTSTISGDEPKVARSKARPHKPPAKAISARKAAALKTGGGKLPPKVRKRLEKEPLPRRIHPTDPREKEQLSSTRYGKREPKAGRRERAAQDGETRPVRPSGNPQAAPVTSRNKEAGRARR